MVLQPRAEYFEAFARRDPDYDGRFFIAVKTTGIFCRPICPARPQPQNLVFFASARDAQNAGYRACKRCRPDAIPGSAAWHGQKAVVARAIRLIRQGKLAEAGEEGFARKFGLSARHLRRVFKERLGRTPRQVADELRLERARRSVVETSSPIVELAFHSGFTSLRRFNDAFKRQYGVPPSVMRRDSQRHLKKA